MSPRLRKVTGTVSLLIFIAIYALATIALSTAILPKASPGTELLFYALAGLLWALPAGMIISWMAKP